MKGQLHHPATVLLTVGWLLIVGSLPSPSQANNTSPRPSAPSISEQVQALATHCLAIRDAHCSALQVLGKSQDFQVGFRALRRDLAKLSERLPHDSQLSALAQQARQLAAQLAQALPTGSLTPEDASRLDRDALTTARRAESLRNEITGIRTEITGTLEHAQKWENAFHAFDFDPRRRNHIVSSLIADRHQSLTENPPQPRIEPDPDLPKAPLAQTSPPAAFVLFDPVPSGEITPPDLPTEDAPPTIEIRPAILIKDPLLSALDRFKAEPHNPKTQRHLNNECFKKLADIGPQVLQPGSRVKLSVNTMEQLEAAAVLKVPAALHLLALMHLTGQGSGLNYPRGTAYIKEAAKTLDANPLEPFGPGIDAERAAETLSQVGTSWFWLAETYLLGLMEQQPEKAAALYRTADQYGDPRAQQRIRQLTAVDRSRVFISWPPGGADSERAPSILGLVEHCGTDLDELEARLATRTELTQVKTKPKPGPVVTDDILRPFLGIDFVQDYPGRGVSVRHVLVDSPADLAGLRPGDLIIQVNERSTSSLESFGTSLLNAKPGDQLKLRVLRPDQPPIELIVKLGTITFLNDAIEAVLEPVRLPSMWNPHRIGFRIISVRPNSPAARSGMHPNDIVVGANDRHLRDWNDLATAIHNRNGLTTLLIQRRPLGAPPQLLSAVISNH